MGLSVAEKLFRAAASGPNEQFFRRSADEALSKAADAQKIRFGAPGTGARLMELAAMVGDNGKKAR